MAIKILLALLVTLASILFLYKEIDLELLIDYLKKTSLPFFGLSIFFLAAHFFVRSVRLQKLIVEENCSLQKANSIILISNLANLILPLRLGELVKTYMICQLTNTRFTAAVTIVFIERALDILTLGLLTFYSLFSLNFQIHLNETAKILFISAILALMVLIFVVKIKTVRVSLSVWIRKISIIEKLGLRRFALAPIMSFKKVSIATGFLYSLPVWLFTVLHHMASLQAQGISNSFEKSILVTVLNSLSISLPSTPGFIGPYEASYVAAAKILSTSPEQFLASSVLSHSANYIYLIPVCSALLIFNKSHISLPALFSKKLRRNLPEKVKL